MDLESAIERLATMISNARPVMLSQQNIQIEKNEAVRLISIIQDGLPDELRNARWVIKEREEILYKARREAAQILEDAKAERDHIVSQHEITRQARREAHHITEEARDEGRHIKLEAEDWIEANLNHLSDNLRAFEATVTALRENVSRAQRKLNKQFEHLPAFGADPAAGEGEDHDDQVTGGIDLDHSGPFTLQPVQGRGAAFIPGEGAEDDRPTSAEEGYPHLVETHDADPPAPVHDLPRWTEATTPTQAEDEASPGGADHEDNPGTEGGPAAEVIDMMAPHREPRRPVQRQRPVRKGVSREVVNPWGDEGA